VPKFPPDQEAANVPSAGTCSDETAAFLGVSKSITIQISQTVPRFRSRQ